MLARVGVDGLYRIYRDLYPATRESSHAPRLYETGQISLPETRSPLYCYCSTASLGVLAVDSNFLSEKTQHATKDTTRHKRCPLLDL